MLMNILDVRKVRLVKNNQINEKRHLALSSCIKILSTYFCIVSKIFICFPSNIPNRKLERERRHKRVRTKISGTSECPRLCVFRSNTNLYAQIIDDSKGITLVQASTLDKEVKTKHSNKEAAKEVGTLIAKRALAKKIENVVYDRGGYVYHGVVKELAESAREAGLKF